jgi:tRNA (adenine22-N1)-methyltransferase
MTHAEDVRRFLYKNGFSILKENAVQDGSHFYIALCAQYTGAPTACSPGLPYLGRLPECHSEAALIYLNRQHQRLLTRVEALRRR